MVFDWPLSQICEILKLNSLPFHFRVRYFASAASRTCTKNTFAEHTHSLEWSISLRRNDLFLNRTKVFTCMHSYETRYDAQCCRTSICFFQKYQPIKLRRLFLVFSFSLIINRQSQTSVQGSGPKTAPVIFAKCHDDTRCNHDTRCQHDTLGAVRVFVSHPITHYTEYK